MQATYHKIHPNFKLNGISYTALELKEVGYNLTKEGKPFEQAIGVFLLNWLDDKPVIDVKTSGSTGKPKIITLQKQHMTNSALATAGFFGIQAGTTAFLCLPVDYIAGKMMLVRAVTLGLEIDYVTPSSNPLKKVLKNYDFAAMIPLQLKNSLEQVNQIKILIIGGAPLSSTLKNKVQDKVAAIFETYGMTETITHIAVKKVNDSNPTSDTLSGHTMKDRGKVAERSRSEIFTTLPHITLSTDNRDCLVIDAPRISSTTVVTNDLVNLQSPTQFKWLGRYDNIINSGGVKLVPEQIEKKLSSLISNRFFVCGLPDEKLGQKLVLVVEGNFDSGVLLESINAFGGLERFEVPKLVLTVSKFTESTNGKIQRSETLNTVYKPIKPAKPPY